MTINVRFLSVFKSFKTSYPLTFQSASTLITNTLQLRLIKLNHVHREDFLLLIFNYDFKLVIHTHIRTIRSGRCLPLQLDDVISFTKAAPAGRCHSPWFVFTGGHCYDITGSSSKTVPTPHSILIGGEGRQFGIYLKVRKVRRRGASEIDCI